jgi:hypothetical protein
VRGDWERYPFYLELLEEVKAKDERERHRSASKKASLRYLISYSLGCRLTPTMSVATPQWPHAMQCVGIQSVGWERQQQELLVLCSHKTHVCCMQAREGNVRMKTGKGGLAQREALLDSHKHRKQSRKRVREVICRPYICSGWRGTI